MPDDIDKVVKNLRKRRRDSDDDEEDLSDDEGTEESPDFFEDSRSKEGSDENATKKKFIAFLMLSPMIISGFLMMSDALKRFNVGQSAMRITATVGGACIALYTMAKVPQLREAVKFVVCFSWIVFLLPTYQVYSCSPIELKNSMLGTWFKLKTDPQRFLESSYVTSDCFRAFYLATPYSLSMVSPKISLVIQIEDLINLDGSGGKTKEKEDSSKQSHSYFLAVSKRSVKKKFHKLYLLFEADGKEADMMMKSLKLTAAEKDKHLLTITGAVTELGDELLPMKKELENINYLVRPIKFKVISVTYRDKYIKLKPSAEESMY